MSNADIVLKWAFDRLLNGATKVTKAIHSSLEATILVLAGLEEEERGTIKYSKILSEIVHGQQ